MRVPQSGTLPRYAKTYSLYFHITSPVLSEGSLLKMIRDGKDQGWLQLPIDTLHQWALLQNVEIDEIHFGTSPDEAAKGAGLYTKRDYAADDGFQTTLLTVPRDLILSRERVEEHAKVDKDFRAVLESLGEFGRTSRIAILALLLTQSTLAVPSLSESHFVHSPFSSYMKYLPMESLPTFWTEEERELLTGTTLLPAIVAKINSLYREFDTFRTLTSTIPWIESLWWEEIDGIISFDDWLQVDAMYRSRALEFPGIGDCMAPCIDMANHASGSSTAAIYEVNSSGDAVLLLRPNHPLRAGQEITISYGDSKGPCEMLFSYGFIDPSSSTAASTLFLDLPLPPDDPLAKAKSAIASAAPGVKLSSIGRPWEGEYIWLLAVNEEDGLAFKIQRTVAGDEELKAFFADQELASAADLHRLLARSPMWDVFQLRAVALLQDRVAEQLTLLYGSDERVAAARGVGERVKGLALRLRGMEAELLEQVYAHLEERKEELARSEVVIEYLEGPRGGQVDENMDEDEEDEDFS